MDAFIELQLKDSDARTYVEIACMYLFKRLLNGEYGSTTRDRFIATELAASGDKVMEALEG